MTIAKQQPNDVEQRAANNSQHGENAPHSWTLQQTLIMLQRGHHPRDIARMRNRSEATIVNHMMTLAARDEDFDLTPHADAELLEELREKAADWQPGDSLRPVVEALDGEYDSTTLKIHLLQVFRE